MKQYQELLKAIIERGTDKPAARENMPGTRSLFGYQFRHNLQDGFPLLTTKELSFKNIVVELLWFLKGDTNIKFLIDNGCNIWNEDAYQYYLKLLKSRFDKYQNKDKTFSPLSFEIFIDIIKNNDVQEMNPLLGDYKYGDCGFQYGKVWRNWELQEEEVIKTGETYPSGEFKYDVRCKTLDQIKNLIEGLKNNPESRRHIVTAIDPAHDTDLALYWCHCMFQFNCRSLTVLERSHYAVDNAKMHRNELMFDSEETGLTLEQQLNDRNIPKYYLDCQMYQRSADTFLGVPYNIASYALLTHIFAKMCNMVPGEYIHSFGDVHIYDQHLNVVNEQLNRECLPLPKLSLQNVNFRKNDFDVILQDIEFNGILEVFRLENYNSHPKLKGDLFTGLVK